MDADKYLSQGLSLSVQNWSDFFAIQISCHSLCECAVNINVVDFWSVALTWEHTSVPYQATSGLQRRRLDCASISLPTIKGFNLETFHFISEKESCFPRVRCIHCFRWDRIQISARSPFSCGDIGDRDADTQMGRTATIGVVATFARAPFLKPFGARAFLTGDMFYFHLQLKKVSQKPGCSRESRC